jgi:hypothetical protein
MPAWRTQSRRAESAWGILTDAEFDDQKRKILRT